MLHIMLTHVQTIAVKTENVSTTNVNVNLGMEVSTVPPNCARETAPIPWDKAYVTM